MILLLLFLFSGVASAYPENIRHGYPSCTGCHVSPVGGGTLTPYGRGSSEAFISTWSVEHEGDFGYGALALPAGLALGGDLRGVAIVTQDNTNHLTSTYIPMQADVEAAVTLLPGLLVDGSAGLYGPERTAEYRRLYLKIDPLPGLSFRAGRFLPAYGINLPDHTTWVRRDLGFGEGRESNNVEAAWIGRRGEALATYRYGDDTTLRARAPGYQVRSQASGPLFRGALYLGSTTQVGASYQRVDHMESYGGFLQTGITTHGYLLTELDRRFDGQILDLALVKAGWEIAQGLMMTFQQEIDVQPDNLQTSIGLQWWPRPHWELLGEARRSYQDGTGTTTGVLMLHHYL